MAQPKPQSIPTHCMLVLPAGLRRVSEPNDDHSVVARSWLGRFVSRLAAALRA
jgi:hypothetical protein